MTITRSALQHCEESGERVLEGVQHSNSPWFQSKVTLTNSTHTVGPGRTFVRWVLMQAEIWWSVCGVCVIVSADQEALMTLGGRLRSPLASRQRLAPTAVGSL